MRNFEIESLNSPEFREAFDLYDQTFPESEKEDLSSFQRWLIDKSEHRLYPDNYHLIVFKETATSPVIGVASFHYLASANCGFLGYLVVHSKARDQGIGSELFAEIKR